MRARNYPNYITRRNPIDFIARPNAILFRNRFWNGNLEFACDLSHNPYFNKDNFLVKVKKGKAMSFRTLFVRGRYSVIIFALSMVQS